MFAAPSRGGSPPQPHLRLNPALRETYLATLGSVRGHGRRIAQLAGYAQLSHLSYVMHCRRVVATPRTVERLQNVAIQLGFPTDAIFLPEPEEWR